MDFGVFVVIVGILFLIYYAYIRLKKVDQKQSSSGIHPADICLKEGNWKVLKSVEPSKFEVKDLELVSFVDTDRSRVVFPGEVMRWCAVQVNANLGLDDAKRTFDHQAEIPVEFQNYCMVFTGTLLMDPTDAMGVICLACGCGRWSLFVARLNITRFDVSYRLVRCKPVA